MEKNTMKKEERTSFKKDVLEFGITLAVSLLVVFLLVNFVVRPIRVDGNSMYPTLKTDSLGFSNIIGRNNDGIERFDIVVVKVTDEETSKTKYLVKRAIGLPGETVSYLNGVLYINGEEVQEDFLDANYLTSFGGKGVFTGTIDEITLKDNEYYLLGDNRMNSKDSRFYGPFEEQNILSKGVFILLPFSDFGVKTW